MDDPKKLEVGNPCIVEAWRQGVDHYQPLYQGRELEVEAGTTDSSLKNIRKMVEAWGRRVVSVNVGPDTGCLFCWQACDGIAHMTYLATGFGVGYSGTGPNGLAQILVEVLAAPILKPLFLARIASLPRDFTGYLLQSEKPVLNIWENTEPTSRGRLMAMVEFQGGGNEEFLAAKEISILGKVLRRFMYCTEEGAIYYSEVESDE